MFVFVHLYYRMSICGFSISEQNQLLTNQNREGQKSLYNVDSSHSLSVKGSQKCLGMVLLITE